MVTIRKVRLPELEMRRREARAMCRVALTRTVLTFLDDGKAFLAISDEALDNWQLWLLSTRDGWSVVALNRSSFGGSRLDEFMKCIRFKVQLI